MRLLLILLLTLNLLNAKKIALLIGNSDYNFAPLANPLNDVDGIKNTLVEIGFAKSDITVLRNSSKSEMENALLNFEEKAQNAEIALIYFSGHGMQVENINYMFPAKTTATKPIHLKKLVDLEMFIESATSAKYGIILVDACRNNPLVKYFQNGKHKGDSAKKGLGQVTPRNGQVVIGFATSAGDTADDGDGDMSPYASALAYRLKEKDDIRNILGKVTLDVSKNYNQNPIYRANLASSVYLSKINIIHKYEKIDSKPISVSQSNNKNVIVIDNLMWQDNPVNKSKEITWKQAMNYCHNLSLYGYSDWILPSNAKLSSLFKNKNKLSNVVAHGYWTATPHLKNSNYAWVVHFYNTYANYTYHKASNYYVRCVRTR